MAFVLRIILVMLALMLTGEAIAGRVIINRPLSDNDVRYQYPELLLQMVLDATESEYGADRVVQADQVMPRDTAFLELVKGEVIQVMAEAPKPDWEEHLIPIRIPIRKGVQGFRVFLIMKENQHLLRQIGTLQEFIQLPTGSGAQWSTARVMRDAGFDVISSDNYEELFEMLANGRFHTFGRGVNEVYSEFYRNVTKFPELRVDDALMLYIPLPTYFFVTPKRPDLAKRIEAGLMAMIADGRFDDFFCRYHSQDIEAANIGKRKVFCIPNANLSSQTPFERREFWTSERCGLNISPIDYSRAGAPKIGQCTFQ
ncbi:hypothetical protein BTA51_04500 [Hahella sp. CCB-MM4]|uniref:hypothetical protein n=1 Tax=Hahella sp. (strain CCB-MM4) TaxID=1926491 RepID=UPI000B9C243B|nr:hypothetical protein [Hahella sp. CCB-MM4]OZG74281.1 hypothetical protein BTA51_04500 [Hahella sp. CCB-MM4]